MLDEILEAVRKGYDIKFGQVPVHHKLHDYNLRIEVIYGDRHEVREISPINIGDSLRQFEDSIHWTIEDLVQRMDTYKMITEVLY